MAIASLDCRLCGGTLPVKDRRVIFGPTFKVIDQLSQILGYLATTEDGLSRHVCGQCFVKLNKLSRLQFDLTHKLDSLRAENDTLVAALREKHKHARKPLCVTPVSKKRVIIHSPTPRKTKKALTFSTPSKVSDQVPKSPKTVTLHVLPTSSIGDLGQTRKRPVKLFSPDKVKVMYRTKTDARIRSKIIKDIQLSQSIKNLAIHNSKLRTAKALMKTPLKEHIHKCIVAELQTEISRLTSTINKFILRNLDYCLTTFKFANLNTEVATWAPLFHQLITTIVKDSKVGTAVTSAVALKFRNTLMSAFQHIISQILDHGGATDETISILNKLGLSVSTQATSNMRSNLMERQRKHTKVLMLEEKQEIEHPTGRSVQLKSAEIIGDNIDITRRPSHMTKENKGHSWHWFLLVGVEKRVLNPFLDDSAPLAEITKVDNSQFVPSLAECTSMEKRFTLHIMKVLVKYMDCFKKYSDCIPEYIPHPHIEETSKKSDFAILDLLDKSENK